MMWMHQHQDRVLRLPEGEGGGGSGAGGQPATGSPQGESAGQPPAQLPTDMISRDEARRAFEQRDMAKRDRDAAVAERDRLAAELEQLKRPAQSRAPETTQPKPEPDGSASELRSRLDKLEAERKAEKQAERQRTLSERVAASVPNDKLRSLIPTIIRDMHPAGVPEGDVDAIAATLLGQIKSNHPSLFDLPPGSPRTAQQVGPTGQINWAEIKSLAEVPPGVKIPTEVYERFRGNNQGDTGLILGSRAARPSK